MLRAHVYVPFFNDRHLLDEHHEVAARALNCSPAELVEALHELEVLNAIERFDHESGGSGYRASEPKLPVLLPMAAPDAGAVTITPLGSKPMSEAELRRLGLDPDGLVELDEAPEVASFGRRVELSLGGREEPGAALAHAVSDALAGNLHEVGAESAWPGPWPDDALRVAAKRLVDALVTVGRVNDAEQLGRLVLGREPARHPRRLHESQLTTPCCRQPMVPSDGHNAGRPCVMFNEANQVVQCHRCGAVWFPVEGGDQGLDEGDDQGLDEGDDQGLDVEGDDQGLDEGDDQGLDEGGLDEGGLDEGGAFTGAPSVAHRNIAALGHALHDMSGGLIGERIDDE